MRLLRNYLVERNGISVILHRHQVPAHHDAIPAPAFAAEHGPVSDEQQFLPVLGIFRQGGDAVAGRNLDLQPFISAGRRSG